MITKDINGRKVLEIFERFIVDTTLPKHAGKKVEYSNTPQQGFVVWGANSGTNSTVVSGNWGTPIQYISGSTEKPSLIIRGFREFVRLWCCVTGKCKTTYVRVTATPVQEVFEAVLGRGKRLEVLEGRLEAHRDAIKEAKLMGQIALAESLEKQTPSVELEAILVATEKIEVISEDLLIEFTEKCERGLKLDWIKNFTRLIPQDVRIKKLKMDRLNAFDNYLVLHFDPNNKGAALTKKEVEKKKDPILFGVIEGSRKLYHIGSWVDEFCNLTFNDLLDKYGKDALTLK